MRLYYHADSDSLFWSATWPDDGQCDDVTDDAAFQDTAATRGIKCPGPITPTVAYYKELPSDSSPTDVANAFAEVTSGGLAGAIQASYKKWERKPSDFYPTPYEGTESIMPVIDTMFAEGCNIWEPCCGDMDMVRVLEWHGHKVTATDIRDTGQFVGNGTFDFLNGDPLAEMGWEPDPDWIVMNPPFSLAKEFIEKALSYTPNVACLLKIDYWNAISRLPLFLENRPHFIFPLTFRLAFLKDERGNSPLMNCMWVVWTADEYKDCGKDITVFEPIKKRLYPGYNRNGVRTGLAKLGQALDGLRETIANGRPHT